MREVNAKEEMRLPVMAPDMTARCIGSAGEGHNDKPTRHCWVLPSRQTTFLSRSATYQGRASARDGLQTQAKPPRQTPTRRTNIDSARTGGASRWRKQYALSFCHQGLYVYKSCHICFVEGNCILLEHENKFIIISRNSSPDYNIPVPTETHN